MRYANKNLNFRQNFANLQNRTQFGTRAAHCASAIIPRMKGLGLIGKIALLSYVVMLAASPGYSLEDRDQEKCDATKQKIQRLQSKMRQGYTARQGIRMDDEMRRLKKRRSKYCR